MTAPIAVGVDVAARRGCDVVALDATLVALPVGRVHHGDELRTLLAEMTPAIVAIDAPPAWAPEGRARRCERELAALGISVFTTPDAARGETNEFYAWMRTGFEMFAAARPYPTLEVFPHACAVALVGCLPTTGLLRNPKAKRAWRSDALHTAGVNTDALRTQDHIDAALCALTGLRHLAGETMSLGDPAEGTITLPTRTLPRRYTRGRERASAVELNTR